MANAIDYRTAMEILGHEAIVRQAYKDSVGVWTWSVGITSASGHSVERYIGKPQSMAFCIEVFIWVLRRYADDVNRAFAGHDLTQAQFAAALSFHYNTGAIGTATWVKKFKAGDIAGAKKSIMDWRKPPEIVPRRTRERDLFFSGKWSGTGTVLEYGVSTSGKPVSPKRVNIEADVLLAISGASPGVTKPDPAPRPPIEGLPPIRKPNPGPAIFVLLTGAVAGAIWLGTKVAEFLTSIGVLP